MLGFPSRPGLLSSSKPETWYILVDQTALRHKVGRKPPAFMLRLTGALENPSKAQRGKSNRIPSLRKEQFWLPPAALVLTLALLALPLAFNLPPLSPLVAHTSHILAYSLCLSQDIFSTKWYMML